MKTAYALPFGSTAGVQIEGVPTGYCPIDICGDYTVRCWRNQPFKAYISGQHYRAISCTMPLPMPTTAVIVTTSLVSTPLPSSVTPSSLFDSPFGNISATEKEMTTVSAAHEATIIMDAAKSDAGGSSSGITDDGARLGDDLYLPTINWDPNM
ncbi:hypothetical protein Hanom_Chr11g01014661 [Helianthus anomalus]